MNDLVLRATQFAVRAHGDQLYGSLPYFAHLHAVASVLVRFGAHYSVRVADVAGEELLAAAYLHDTLEDTKTTQAGLLAEFGPTITELVYLVTDEAGKNRRERHERTYPKTRMKAAAVMLKLADRIANVEHSIRMSDDGKLRMYRKEQALFASYLYRADEFLPMWDHLSSILKEHP